MKVQYDITLSDEDLNVIARALDFLSRVAGMGQFDEIIDAWIHRSVDGKRLVDPNDHQAIKRALNTAKRMLTGFDPNASFGIADPNVPETSRRAYEWAAALKHAQSWAHDPSGQKSHWHVSYHEPLPTTDFPTPQIVVSYPEATDDDPQG